MNRARIKRPCVCGHGVTIHHPGSKKLIVKKVTACRHPECGCPKYRPVQSLHK